MRPAFALIRFSGPERQHGMGNISHVGATVTQECIATGAASTECIAKTFDSEARIVRIADVAFTARSRAPLGLWTKKSPKIRHFIPNPLSV